MDKDPATISPRIFFADQEQFSKTNVKNSMETSETIGEALNKLGLGNNRGDYRKFHRLVAHYGLQDIRLKQKEKKPRNYSPPITDEAFFVEGIYRGGVKIRTRLLRLGWDYKCSDPECDLKGNTTWKGQPIVFQVDHINGNSLDNRLENLRFLCAMCHSQTETYGSKNLVRYDTCACGLNKKSYLDSCPVCLSERKQRTKREKEATPRSKKEKAAGLSSEVYFCACGNPKLKSSKSCEACVIRPRKIEWPEVDELVERVQVLGYFALGKELGVSDKAIVKHLQRLEVNPLPKKMKKTVTVPCSECGRTEGKSPKSLKCQECVSKTYFQDWPSTEILISSIRSDGLSKVAKQLGVHHATLRKHLQNSGVDTL